MDAHRGVQRPAFYALAPGGWRDLVTLLHPPYTAWHLSYVALGAAAAPVLHADRLVAALGAFFLGVGICAHALDELHGRPLHTRLSDRTLIALAGVSLAGAVAQAAGGRRRGGAARRAPRGPARRRAEGARNSHCVDCGRRGLDPAVGVCHTRAMDSRGPGPRLVARP